MQRNTGYFPTESLEPSGNRLFSRSALNEGYLFRGSLGALSVERANADFGWRPRFSIEQGMELYLEWLRAHESN